MSEPTERAASKAVLTAAYPQLFVADIKASCDFYTQKLGFEVTILYGEPPFYAHVARGGATLILRHVDRPVFDAEFRDREELLSAECGVDSAELAPLTTGAAIEFNWEDSGQFTSFLATLLDNLSGSSDFQLVWPGRPVICVIHHHTQLWWTTPDDSIYLALNDLLGRATTGLA